MFKKLLQAESEMAPLAEMPNKIKKALILIGIYVLLNLIRNVLHSLITVEEQGWEPLVSGVSSILFFGFFAFKIRQGKNWAKITMLVIFLMNIISLPLGIMGVFVFKPVLGVNVITLIQIPIVIMILVYLFNKESDPWFKGTEKNLEATKEAAKEVASEQQIKKALWFWGIIPLSILGYELGCGLDTGGNLFAGIIMIFGHYISPYVFLPLLIPMLILYLIGLKKKNQILITFVKISLLLIAFPLTYAAGVIFCN